MPNHSTYDTDFNLWTQQQAALLRQGRFQAIDVVNLAEEIESMGKSDRRAIESYLANILFHLLKWQYQPERRSTSWKLSIRNSRHQVAKRLKESPSFKPSIADIIFDEYQLAKDYAADETGLPLATFPDQCQFTIEQVLDTEYWPD